MKINLYNMRKDRNEEGNSLLIALIVGVIILIVLVFALVGGTRKENVNENKNETSNIQNRDLPDNQVTEPNPALPSDNDADLGAAENPDDGSEEAPGSSVGEGGIGAEPLQ